MKTFFVRSILIASALLVPAAAFAAPPSQPTSKPTATPSAPATTSTPSKKKTVKKHGTGKPVTKTPAK